MSLPMHSFSIMMQRYESHFTEILDFLRFPNLYKTLEIDSSKKWKKIKLSFRRVHRRKDACPESTVESANIKMMFHYFLSFEKIKESGRTASNPP